MKTITNTIARGGFDSPRVASRERNNTKGGSRTSGRELGGLKSSRRRPPTTHQRRRGGFNSLGVAPRERNSTKGGSRTPSRTLGSSRPLENNHQQMKGGLIH
jgi:hypothetical protein